LLEKKLTIHAKPPISLISILRPLTALSSIKWYMGSQEYYKHAVAPLKIQFRGIRELRARYSAPLPDETTE
jgi:hypothetical protein